MSFSTCGNCGEVISLSPCKCNQAKTLTDEEIRALWNPMPDTKVYVRDLITFARAILRKAQEADNIESLGTVNIGGVHFRNGKEVK